MRIFDSRTESLTLLKPVRVLAVSGERSGFCSLYSTIESPMVLIVIMAQKNVIVQDQMDILELAKS